MGRLRAVGVSMWVDYDDYGPESVKPGDKLRVVRLPVLQRTDPPAERESVKTVIAIIEGRNKLVQLKEHKTKTGGVHHHKYFRIGPREMMSGPPRPIRYQILEVLPSIVIEE